VLLPGAGSLDLEPAGRRASPVPAAGDPGGGRDRRADFRHRRREGCGRPGGPRLGGDDESGRCRQVADLLRRAAPRRTRRGRSRSGRRRRRACRHSGEGAARCRRRGTHPRAGGFAGERRRLRLDRAAAPRGPGGHRDASGAVLSLAAAAPPWEERTAAAGRRLALRYASSSRRHGGVRRGRTRLLRRRGPPGAGAPGARPSIGRLNS